MGLKDALQSLNRAPRWVTSPKNCRTRCSRVTAGSVTATPTGCGVLVSHPLGFVQVYPNGASACGRSEDTSGSTSIPVSSFAARRAPQGVGRRPWLSSASQVWNSAAKRLRRSRSSGTSNPSLSPIAAATSSSKLSSDASRSEEVPSLAARRATVARKRHSLSATSCWIAAISSSLPVSGELSRSAKREAASRHHLSEGVKKSLRGSKEVVLIPGW